MEESLMVRTHRLLRESPNSIADIAAELHGSHVSFYWLRKFSAGHIKNPSVNKVQVLYEHLSGKALLEPVG